MTPPLSNKTKIPSNLGDFWARADGDAARMLRSLSGLSERASVLRTIQNAQDLLTGKAETVEEQITVAFHPDDVIRLGSDLQQRVLTHYGTSSQSFDILRRPLSSDDYGNRTRNWLPVQGTSGDSVFNLMTASAELLLFPIKMEGRFTLEISTENLKPRYLLPIADDMIPVVITTPARDLVLGLDFTLAGSMLVFEESPITLFPDQLIQIRTARCRHRHLFSYTWQVDELSGDGHFLADYLRARQTPAQFQAAIGEAAGLALVPKTAVLVETIEGDVSTRYLFNDFVIEVGYKHEPLVVGNTYQEGYIVGEAVQVKAAVPGIEWYRCVTWEQGLSMDAFCPVPGLRLMDAETQVKATANGASNLHVRFEMSGGLEANDAFWDFQNIQEDRTGRYLNSVIGLSQVGDTDTINPLEFYFDHLLSHRGLLIVLKSDILGADRLRRAQDFIHREKPVGSIPIIVIL